MPKITEMKVDGAKIWVAIPANGLKEGSPLMLLNEYEIEQIRQEAYNVAIRAIIHMSIKPLPDRPAID